MSQPKKSELIGVYRTLRTMREKVRTCPVAYYKPHPGQAEFHAALDPTVIAMCGNRWGKTHAGVCDCQATLLGYRPWQVPDFALKTDSRGRLSFPDREEVPTEAWVLRTDGVPIEMPSKVAFVTGLPIKHGIGEILEPKFRDLWPSSVRFHASNGSAGVWDKITLPNGSSAFFGSSSQPNLAWEGFNATNVLADEPIRRALFTALKRGLIDTMGQFKWTMTPLGGSEMAWIAADLIETGKAAIVRGSSYDNPTLSRKALDEFFSDSAMSEEEKRARLYGDLAILGYRILTTFGPHATMDPQPLPDSLPRVMVVDPHHSKPHACIWAAVIGEGSEREYIVYREWPTDDFSKMGASKMTLREFNATIRQLEGKERVVARIADPQFGPQKAKVLGTQFPSFVDEMARYGLHFETRIDNDLDRGIPRLRDAFEISNVTGNSRVRVMSHCKNTIRAAKLWSYEVKDTGELKPSESYKDFADCLRYLVMSDEISLSAESWTYLDDDDEE